LITPLLTLRHCHIAIDAIAAIDFAAISLLTLIIAMIIDTFSCHYAIIAITLAITPHYLILLSLILYYAIIDRYIDDILLILIHY
jgi:hypothetical protein